MGTTGLNLNDDYATLEPIFKKQIEGQYDLTNVEVGILSTELADLNNDGEQDDLAGTAILKSGRFFKSFIFLHRADGSTRFLENDGSTFQREAKGRILFCFNKPCSDTMERARQQILGVKISVREVDKERKGLEVVIDFGRDGHKLLNSLDVFLAK